MSTHNGNANYSLQGGNITPFITTNVFFWKPSKESGRSLLPAFPKRNLLFPSYNLRRADSESCLIVHIIKTSINTANGT